MNWRRHGHVERNLRLFSHWNDPLVPQSSRKQKIVKQYQSKWTLLHSLTKIQLDWCPSLGLHFLQDLHGFRLESFGRDLIADLDQNLFRSVQRKSKKKGLSKCNRKKRQLAPGQHLHFAATSFLQGAQNGITGKVPKQPRSPVDHLVKHLLTYCISKKGECTQLGENIVMSVTSCAIHVCGKPFVPPPRP